VDMTDGDRVKTTRAEAEEQKIKLESQTFSELEMMMRS